MGLSEILKSLIKPDSNPQLDLVKKTESAYLEIAKAYAASASPSAFTGADSIRNFEVSLHELPQFKCAALKELNIEKLNLKIDPQSQYTEIEIVKSEFSNFTPSLIDLKKALDDSEIEVQQVGTKYFIKAKEINVPSRIRSADLSQQTERFYRSQQNEEKKFMTAVYAIEDGSAKPPAPECVTDASLNTTFENEFTAETSSISNPDSGTRMARNLDNVTWVDYATYDFLFDSMISHPVNNDKDTFAIIPPPKLPTFVVPAPAAPAELYTLTFDELFDKYFVNECIVKRGNLKAFARKWNSLRGYSGFPTEITKHDLYSYLGYYFKVGLAAIDTQDGFKRLYQIFSEKPPEERITWLKSIPFKADPIVAKFDNECETIFKFNYPSINNTTGTISYSSLDLSVKSITNIGLVPSLDIKQLTTYGPYGSKIIEAIKWEWMRILPLLELQHRDSVAAKTKDSTAAPASTASQVSNVQSWTRDTAVTKLTEYPFDIYTPYSINLGVRLVYRQEWRPLGIQRGEIVKSLPLGPKQSQKISIKSVKKNKTSQSNEMGKEIETSFETTDTNKHSQEVSKETSEEKKLSAEVGASYLKMVSFKASASADWSSKVKNTVNDINEMTAKSASKSKFTSKVVVSTESESSFENENSSEILNPNDETAVTYIYSKMQQQYQIYTALAQVEDIIAIAEDVPSPTSITVEWIRRYDWILAKSLLNESYRSSLDMVSSEVPTDMLDTATMQKISALMGSVSDGIESLSTNTGSMANIDVVSQAQKTFRDTIKEEAEKLRQQKIRQLQQERLISHIRDNILYYCQAIWREEDSQQKMMRYQKKGLMVPGKWKPLPPSTITTTNSQNIPTWWNLQDSRYIVDESGPFYPLTDVIDFSELVGFHGNFAVYKMKPKELIDRNRSSQIFNVQAYYKQELWDAENGVLHDPTISIRTTAVGVANVSTAPFTPTVVPSAPTVDELLADTPKALEIIDMVPELRLMFEYFEPAEQKSKLQDRTFLTKVLQYYPLYLKRLDHTQLLAIDTNDLLVDLEVGRGSILEEFKLKHRAIDAFKAKLEAKSLALEIKRRQMLLAKMRLGDPDVDRVIAVGNMKDLDSIINIGEDTH